MLWIVTLGAIALPWLYFFELIPPVTQLLQFPLYTWGISDYSVGFIALSMCVSVWIVLILSGSPFQKKHLLVLLLPIAVILAIGLLSGGVSIHDTLDMYLILLPALLAGYPLHSRKRSANAFAWRLLSFLRIATVILTSIVLFLYGLTDFL